MTTETNRYFWRNLGSRFWLVAVGSTFLNLICVIFALVCIIILLYIIFIWITSSSSDFDLNPYFIIIFVVYLISLFLLLNLGINAVISISSSVNNIKILGKFKNDIENYDKMLEKSNDDDKAWFSKGLVLFNYDEALRLVKTSKDRLPFLREAEESFKKAAEIKKGRESLYFLARCYIKRGWWAIAEMKFDEALSSKSIYKMEIFDFPNYVLDNYFANFAYSRQTTQILYEKAEILQKMRKYEEALRVYDDLLKEDEYESKYKLNKGICLLKMGKYNEALQCFEAISVYASIEGDICKFKGLAYNKLGKYEEAIDNFNRAFYRTFNENDGEIWYNKGLALQALNRKKDARSSFWKAWWLNYHPEFSGRSWWHFW